MNVEERLQDVLSAYREQVTVSPGLLGRIETRLEPRHVWVNPRVLRPLAIALIVIAMVAVSVAVLRATGSDDTSDAAHEATATAAGRACDGLTRALAEARIVFETPAAYESVAAARADIARAAADRLRRAAATGDDRRGIVSAIANFEAAAHQADLARAAAARGDLDAARGEFDRFDGAIAAGRGDLAAMGAPRCNEEERPR